MNYKQTIEYLYNRLPMFSKIGQDAIKKDLHNIRKLCNLLGNPQNKFRTIHIAGTNGKGSTSHILASLFQAKGYRTGLYTSPHLFDFRERIKINGELCKQKFIIDFVEQIKPNIEQIDPSFFEVTVAMAFQYFALHQVDMAIIETGLGGRLDSTNIVQPILSIITNVEYDHQSILGNTRAEIAYEKAGIIKKNIPAVIGEVNPETKPIFETKKKITKIYYGKAYFECKKYSLEGQYAQFEILDKTRNELDTYKLDLLGVYQKHNLITCLTALKILNEIGYNFSKIFVQKTLSSIQEINPIYGRWQRVGEQPQIYLDVAHNLNGIEAVIKQLKFLKYNKLHIIIGLSKDKDVEGIIKLLPKEAVYYFTKADIPRALDEKELKKIAYRKNLQGNDYKNVEMAYYKSLQSSTAKDCIIIMGSVFVVGSFLEFYQKRKNKN